MSRNCNIDLHIGDEVCLRINSNHPLPSQYQAILDAMISAMKSSEIKDIIEEDTVTIQARSEWNEEELASLSSPMIENAILAYREKFPQSARSNKALQVRHARIHKDTNRILIDTPKPQQGPIVSSREIKSRSFLSNDEISLIQSYTGKLSELHAYYMASFPNSLRTKKAVKVIYQRLSKGIIAISTESCVSEVVDVPVILGSECDEIPSSDISSTCTIPPVTESCISKVVDVPVILESECDKIPSADIPSTCAIIPVTESDTDLISKPKRSRSKLVAPISLRKIRGRSFLSSDEKILINSYNGDISELFTYYIGSFPNSERTDKAIRTIYKRLLSGHLTVPSEILMEDSKSQIITEIKDNDDICHPNEELKSIAIESIEDEDYIIPDIVLSEILAGASWGQDELIVLKKATSRQDAIECYRKTFPNSFRNNDSVRTCYYRLSKKNPKKEVIPSYLVESKIPDSILTKVLLARSLKDALHSCKYLCKELNLSFELIESLYMKCKGRFQLNSIVQTVLGEGKIVKIDRQIQKFMVDCGASGRIWTNPLKLYYGYMYESENPSESLSFS